jgi:hypothetical protein
MAFIRVVPGNGCKIFFLHFVTSDQSIVGVITSKLGLALLTNIEVTKFENLCKVLKHAVIQWLPD